MENLDLAALKKLATSPLDGCDLVSLYHALPKLIQMVEELREPAAFGQQCYQDRCEGAYIEASVTKRMEKENTALKTEVERLKKCILVNVDTISYQGKENQSLRELLEEAHVFTATTDSEQVPTLYDRISVALEKK